MRGGQRTVCGLLLLLGHLLPASAEPATPAPVDSHRLRLEVRALEAFVSLAVSRPQAEQLLPAMRAIRVARAEIEQARDRLYLDTHDAILTLREQLLAGRALGRREYNQILAANKTFQTARQAALARELEQVRLIDALLTDTQRARIESDEAQAARLAAEQAGREARQNALETARQQLTTWVRRADDAEYRRDRATKISGVVGAAYPTTPPAELQPQTTALGQFYDQVRGLTPQAFATLAPTFPERLGRLLPARRPADYGRYIMSRSEWLEFLRDPLSAEMLLQLLPQLP